MSKAEVNIPDQNYLFSVVFVDNIVEQISIGIFFFSHIGLVQQTLAGADQPQLKIDMLYNCIEINDQTINK